MFARKNHRIISFFLTLFVLLSMLISRTPNMANAAVLHQEPEPKVEVEPGLRLRLNADHPFGYLIYFRERPDLSKAYEMDWETRGRYVVGQLQKTAERSQAKVKTYLESKKIPYQSYWIDNVIVVDQSDLSTFNGLLNFSEIEILRARRQLMMLDPEILSETPNAVDGIEINISRIGTDQVWEMGIDGSGILVANIDTGVRYTHDALVNQYRGNLGGNIFDHNYNWWDPALGDQNLVPDDWHSHGSHTMGTILGDDGGENQIGMAPGASWIACQAFEFSDDELLECGQFMAAPWDLNQQNSNPDLRPHIVNNSWGDCSQVYDPWYDGVINTWHMLGIYPVFSNGNAGNCGYSQPPGLGTVGSPARSGSVTAVGSTNRDDGTYAIHSNWGPTDNLDTLNPRGFPEIKPQVVAPGYDIRSAINSDDSAYQRWVGTSMAAPHVSGLVALMWDAAPCLMGNYTATETIIEETATPIIYDDGSAATPTNYPNYVTGWGEINAYEAVQGAMKYCNIFLIVADPVEQSACRLNTDDVHYALAKADAWETDSPITLSAEGYPVDSNVVFSLNPMVPPATSTLTISNLSMAPPDNYVIDVIAVSPTATYTIALGLNLYSEMPPQVKLSTPLQDATALEQRPLFEWEPVIQAENYLIEIATNEEFATIVLSQTISGYLFMPPTDLATNTVYYWRVKALNTCGDGAYSTVRRFSTLPGPGECAIGENQKLLYDEDFESGAAGWTTSGDPESTWSITNTQAYSGSYAYHANGVSTISDQRLTSPLISLPSGELSALTMQYWNSYIIEAGFTEDVCFDGGILEISTDDGDTWSQIQDGNLLTTPYDGAISINWGNPLRDMNAWCGETQGWVQSFVDLRAFAGQSVRFRYRLGTDSSIGREGWSLDAVRVQSCDTTKYIYLPFIER